MTDKPGKGRNQGIRPQTVKIAKLKFIDMTDLTTNPLEAILPEFHAADRQLVRTHLKCECGAGVRVKSEIADCEEVVWASAGAGLDFIVVKNILRLVLLALEVER